MMQNLKKEFILGLISFAVIAAFAVVSVVRYKAQTYSVAPTSAAEVVAVDKSVVLTNDEILRHNTASDCWITIENKVYAVTDYLSRHPGGKGRITPYCGKDATQPFLTMGGGGRHSSAAFRALGMLYIGDVNGTAQAQPSPSSAKSIQMGRDDYDD